MPFLTEPEPERGANVPVLPGISRIVANNPGPMTYFGTNTYLIDTPDGLVVLDPGPEASGPYGRDPATHRRPDRVHPGQPHASRSCRRRSGFAGGHRRADRRFPEKCRGDVRYRTSSWITVVRSLE